MSRRILSAILIAAISVPVVARDWTIAGSDLAQSVLEPVIAGAAVQGSGTIHLQMDGSRAGLEALRTDRADLAVLVFPPQQALPEMEFRLVPLAYQVAVFAVNGANPARQLTFGQLAGIFGENESTRHRHWGSLGLQGVWAEKSITPNLVQLHETLTLELFKNTALQVPQLATTVTVHPTVAEMLRRLQIDDMTIGLFPFPPAEARGIHLLLIARSEREVPFGPTPENVHNGDYPLRLPFYLAFKPERAAELAPLLRVLLGDEVAAALEKGGFVAVPANARLEARRALGLF